MLPEGMFGHFSAEAYDRIQGGLAHGLQSEPVLDGGIYGGVYRGVEPHLREAENSEQLYVLRTDSAVGLMCQLRCSNLYEGTSEIPNAEVVALYLPQTMDQDSEELRENNEAQGLHMPE